MIKHYRYKPNPIQAVQFEDSNECIVAVCSLVDFDIIVDYTDFKYPVMRIETEEGTHRAEAGDFIVKDGDEVFVLKPEEFDRYFSKD